LADRPTKAVVNLGAISQNIRKIRAAIGKERHLMAVVKADGYGHGAVEVAKTALRHGADYLGVALPGEAKELRRAGIEAPILVLGPIEPNQAHDVLETRVEQTVCSMEVAHALEQAAARAGCRVDVHIKVDTGMGRIGVPPEETLEFVRALNRLPNIRIKGVFSHFSVADEKDKTFSLKQIELFEQVVKALTLGGISIPLRHMANSAALLDLPQSYYDMVRLGIIIYGLYPSIHVKKSIPIIPAMTFKSKILFLKKVAPGTPIGYGRTYHTKKEALVATLPVGYADGYSRLLSNKGQVLIKGVRAPVVGRVCMDMIMVDVTHIPDVSVGQEVILFGEEPSAEEIAQLTGTISYEVVCGVSKRVPRVYISP